MYKNSIQSGNKYVKFNSLCPLFTGSNPKLILEDNGCSVSKQVLIFNEKDWLSASLDPFKQKM